MVFLFYGQSTIGGRQSIIGEGAAKQTREVQQTDKFNNAKAPQTQGFSKNNKTPRI